MKIKAAVDPKRNYSPGKLLASLLLLLRGGTGEWGGVAKICQKEKLSPRSKVVTLILWMLALKHFSSIWRWCNWGKNL